MLCDTFQALLFFLNHKTPEGLEEKNQKGSGAKLDVLCSHKTGAVFSAVIGIDFWMELTSCSHGSSFFIDPRPGEALSGLAASTVIPSDLLIPAADPESEEIAPMDW